MIMFTSNTGFMKSMWCEHLCAIFCKICRVPLSLLTAVTQTVIMKLLTQSRHFQTVTALVKIIVRMIPG